MLKNENKILKQENNSFFEKIKKLEEKRISMRNEYKRR